jgi:hypothetical protein
MRRNRAKPGYRVLPFGMMDLRVYPSRRVVLTDDDGRYLLHFTAPVAATADEIQAIADERLWTMFHCPICGRDNPPALISGTAEEPTSASKPRLCWRCAAGKRHQDLAA